MEHRDVFQQSLSHEFDSIYVIESLPDGDLKTGSSLYDEVIAPQAYAHQMHARLFVAQSNPDFKAALSAIADEARENGLSPIIHIDAHGSPQGLVLGDSSRISWEDLRLSFTEVNISSGFNLLVVLAACWGIFVQELVRPDREAPLRGLIGPTKPVEAGEIEVRFRRFYDVYLQTLNPNSAMEALNDAPLGEPWIYGFRSAVNLFREAWRQYILGFLDPTVAATRFGELAGASGKISSIDEAAGHPLIMKTLAKHRFFVDRFAARFFMYERFPANSARYPAAVDQLAKEVLEEWEQQDRTRRPA